MKRNFLLFFLVTLVAVSFAQKKKEIDVYLIGGQSNATGQGYMVNLPADFEIDKSVQFFYSQKLGGGGTAMEWGPLRCDEPNSPYPDDKVHFNTLGILELGKRFANKINHQLK